MKKLLIALPLLMILVLPVLAGDVGTIDPTKPIPSIDDPVSAIGTIANFMFWMLVAVSTLLVLMAAYLFIFSGGVEEKVAQARNYIIYAIVAIVVGLLARTLGSWVVQMVGTTPTPATTTTTTSLPSV